MCRLTSRKIINGNKSARDRTSASTALLPSSAAVCKHSPTNLAPAARDGGEAAITPYGVRRGARHMSRDLSQPLAGGVRVGGVGVGGVKSAIGE